MKPITLTLIVCLATLSPTTAPAQHREFVEEGVCAIIVAGVGAFVVYGLYQMCKKIPGVPPANPPPPPPPTNPPPVLNPTNMPPTNPPPKKHWWNFATLDGTRIPRWDISNYHIADNFSGLEYHTLCSLTLQSSTNLTQWRDEYNATGWISDAGVFFAYYQRGSNVLNTYCTMGTTNFAAIDIGTGEEPRKFYRLAP